MDRIKKELIHKAQVKKAYKKVKAREEAQKEAEEASKAKSKAADDEIRIEDDRDVDQEEGVEREDEANDANEPSPPSPKLHPERQAMLDNENDESKLPGRTALTPGNDGDVDRPPNRRGHPNNKKKNQRRPGYFDQAMEEGGRKKAEAEERAREAERRQKERENRLAERHRFNRALAKARIPGRDGKRKLGRESGLMLEKVKRLVGDSAAK